MVRVDPLRFMAPKLKGFTEEKKIAKKPKPGNIYIMEFPRIWNAVQMDMDFWVFLPRAEVNP